MVATQLKKSDICASQPAAKRAEEPGRLSGNMEIVVDTRAII
jgi:hypothetical protein